MRRRSRLLQPGLYLPCCSACRLVCLHPRHASAADTSAAAKTKTATPIKHFVTLMQENHSFDNYFGTYPGADGIPEGTCMPVAA